MKRILIHMSFVLSFNAGIHAQHDDPKATEVWEPEPKVITAGVTAQDPPSDAIILFDGKDLSQWIGDNQAPAAWHIEHGAMTVAGTGNIRTKQAFGSCQLHIEWRSPEVVTGDGQNRGNSGVFLMGRYEVQVLDSYNNRTYSNGQAGSIYKQYIPLVNACRPPGEWQAYDIVFMAPVFGADNQVVTPGRLTVFQNGVLIQNNVELKGNTVYTGQPAYERHADKDYLMLQDHGCLVSYRNIWIREL